ncbi:unnamed protein product [Paramecium primaurelia]|uniref:Transmembrane protein n=1 Tax=Paramecium primaurelia TaxID=5886 RepID=A0A8S1MTN5_PARPR|nr:unnamed protein product [Paramecium primaurelia]
MVQQMQILQILIHFYQYNHQNLNKIVVVNQVVLMQLNCLPYNVCFIIQFHKQMKNNLILKQMIIYVNTIKHMKVLACRLKILRLQFNNLYLNIIMQMLLEDQLNLIYNNTAKYGGGLEIEDQMSQNMTRFGSIVANNKAELFGNDSSQVPSQLSITINLIDILPRFTVLEQENLLIQQILIKPYQVFTNEYSDAFYVPNGQQISQYQYFDWNKGEYVPYNLHFRIVALDKLNSIQQDLESTYCDISGRLLMESGENEFTQNFTNIKRIEFNKSDYNLDNLIIYLDDQLNKTLQLQFQCNSIYIPIYDQNKEIVSYHNNYYLRINLKTLPCQMGEIKSLVDSTCVPCNVEQGQYSLGINSNTCLYKDDATTSDIKSAQLKLKAGYWRPYFYTNEISECINLIENCLGGWKEGDTSCYEGHIGALCEECDIYNIRGQGNFFKITQDSTCAECQDSKLNIIITIIFGSLWSIFQIIMTLRSIDQSNQLFSKLKLRYRLSKILFKLDQDHQSILIKMFINYLWIFALIFTFNIQFPIFFGFVDKTSNPSIFLATSVECYTAEIQNIQIIYSRIVLLLILQLKLFLIIYGGYKISSLTNNKIFNNSILSNTAIYLYISNYAEFAKQFTSLLSKRKISNIDFVQGDVSLEYETYTHQQWIMSFVIPGYIIICFLVPFLFFIFLFILKNKLDEIKLRKHICYVFNEYKQENYYWEFIKIMQKIIMIFIIIYFETNIYLKGSLLGLCLLLYQAFALKFKPYIILKFNNLDLQTSQICSISIFIAIGKYASQQQNNFNWSVMLQFFIILLWMKLCYPFIKNILLAYFKIYKINLLTSIHHIIKHCLPNNYLTKFCKRKLIYYEKKQLQINQNFQKLKQYLFSQTSVKRKKLLKNILLFRGSHNKQVLELQRLKL